MLLPASAPLPPTREAELEAITPLAKPDGATPTRSTRCEPPAQIHPKTHPDPTTSAERLTAVEISPNLQPLDPSPSFRHRSTLDDLPTTNSILARHENHPRTCAVYGFRRVFDEFQQRRQEAGAFGDRVDHC